MKELFSASFINFVRKTNMGQLFSEVCHTDCNSYIWRILDWENLAYNFIRAGGKRLTA